MPLLNFDRLRSKSIFELRHEEIRNYILNYPRETNLYEHQIDALNVVYRRFIVEDQKVSVVALPTGAGKSGVAVLTPYFCNFNSVLIITPSKVISSQFEKVHSPDQHFLVKSKIIDKDPKSLSDFIPQLVCCNNGREWFRWTESQSSECHLVIVNAQKISGSETRNVPVHSLHDRFSLVIVDEAHHYPAKTWRAIVDHFQSAKILFLTATPKWEDGDEWCPPQPWFVLSYDEAISREIIRRIETKMVQLPEDEAQLARNGNEGPARWRVYDKMVELLNRHDQEDPQLWHQGMVITNTVEEARTVSQELSGFFRIRRTDEKALSYAEKDPWDHVRLFQSGKSARIRILVVVGKLLEGFDHPPVSVVGILRRIDKKSRVLFTQFVGRAVRKCNDSKKINITAYVVFHSENKQQQENFERFIHPTLPDEDPEDEDNEPAGN